MVKSDAKLLPAGSDSESPERKIGRVQDLFEKTAGVCSAAFRIPTNVASGIIVGGVQGFRKGSGRTEKLSPQATAIGQVGLNTVWGQGYAALTGFLIGGPVGMVTSMVMDGIGATAGIYVFVKSGAAKEVGKRLADSIDSAVKSDDGGLVGTAKGVGAASQASLKAAAVTGFREGKGSVAGLVDGAKAAAEQFKFTRIPRGQLLRSSLRVAAGVATGIMAAPAGVVVALATQLEEREEMGLTKRLLIAGGSGAVLGASMGYLGGPVGMLVGAGLGAAVNLLGPASSKGFSQRIMVAVRRTEKKKDDLGSDIANNNRALFSKGILGAAAAATHVWNDAVRSEPKPKKLTEPKT